MQGVGSQGLMAKKKDDGFKIIADNRKARYAYAIDETLEAGIMLMGSEVKSLRSGKTTIGESYAHAKDGEIVAGQFLYPRIHPGQPLQSRAQAHPQIAGAQARGQPSSPPPSSAKA